MAVLGGGNSNRIATDNKIVLESGTYNVTIVDEWVHYVTKEPDGTYPDGGPKFRSVYSKTPTDDREIKITVTLDDDPSIALESRMAAYVSAKSKLGKLIASLTGMAAGSDEMRAWDTKELRGMKAVADIKFNGKDDTPYSRVSEIRARPKTLRSAARPAESNAAPEAAAATGEPTSIQHARIKTQSLGRSIALDSPRLKKLVGEATEYRTVNYADVTATEAAALLALLDAIPLPSQYDAPAASVKPATTTPSAGATLPDAVVKNVEIALERARVDDAKAAELIAQASIETDGEVTYELRRLSIAAVNALLASVKALQHA
jgi:hypothetical protein